MARILSESFVQLIQEVGHETEADREVEDFSKTDGWYEHIQEDIMRNAFEFWKKYNSRLNLHYPPFYVKGKNGAYFHDVCYIPSNNLYEDYAYYKGVYVNLGFKYQQIQVYGDGIELLPYGSGWQDLDDVQRYFSISENDSVIKVWLRELLQEAEEMFVDFMTTKEN